MRSRRGRWSRVLSVMVLATVLMCQVVGVLCPPVAPALAAADTIRSAYAMHVMEGMNMCQDSIPSSFASFKSLETSSVPLTDAGQPAFHSRPASWTNHPGESLPAEGGHSLLSRLSTFRI